MNYLGIFIGASGGKAKLSPDGITLLDMEMRPFGELRGNDLIVEGTKVGTVIRDVSGRINGFWGPAGEGKYQANWRYKQTLSDIMPCTRLECAELHQIVHGVFPNGFKTYFVNKPFWQLIGMDRFKALLKLDSTDAEPWVQDKYEREDFTDRLKGFFAQVPYNEICVGWAIGGRPNNHNFCVAILDDKKFYVVEPQSDLVVEYQKAPEKYKPLEHLRF